jgi:hypothetical protein
MTTDDLLQHLRTGIPDCMAALAVSLEDGSVTDCRAGEDIDADSMNAVARALCELLEQTRALEAMAGERGASDPKEVIVLLDGRICVGQTVGRHPRSLLAAVCRNTANLGLQLGIIRRELAAAEAMQ